MIDQELKDLMSMLPNLKQGTKAHLSIHTAINFYLSQLRQNKGEKVYEEAIEYLKSFKYRTLT